MKKRILGTALSVALLTSPAYALDEGCLVVPNFTTAAGKSTFICNLAATTAFNWNLPSTAGTAGQVLLSGGGTTNPNTWTQGTLAIGSGVALTVNRTMTLTGVVDGAILSLGGNLTTGSGVALTVNRTMTLTASSDGFSMTLAGSTTVPIATQAITFTGPTSARSYALPDASTTLVSILGNTFTGLISTVASASGSAGLRLPHGSAPSAPTNGDVWTTTTGVFWRMNGTTQQTAFLNSPAFTTPDIGAATGTSLTGSGGALTLSSGGTGALSLNTTGGTQFKITNTASANNFISVTGSNGGNVFMAADGGGTNIGFVFRQKGNEYFYFQDASGNNLMAVEYVASAVNRMDILPAVTTGAPEIFLVGSDSNIDLKLTPKGTGVVRFNNASSFTANNTVATVLGSLGPTGSHTTVQEWFTVKNSSGTVRYIPAF